MQAVMFDLDGTLVDSLADLANATNHALAAVGCPTHPLAAYRHMVGDGARTLCSRALPRDRQDLLDAVQQRMRAHYGAHCFDETRPYSGIVELVEVLTRRGIKQAVLSNKPDDFTKQVVARYFPPFDAVRGHRAGTPLKPDPTAALEIARELNIPAAQWLYLGDTNTDMQTARTAGMKPVGVLWGFRDREELSGSGAESIVATPAEVLKLL